eukprot:TRINITY_DN73978_c0_g1_i1.p1 TRINITY_DN73978_c0_g1~~TRINITY_DN73978_c0_g1_i1.p1  ORF type:complete len:939 (-),score=92.55 TRINITY_DN73978_c0_g1_i1:279-2894(-)
MDLEAHNALRAAGYRSIHRQAGPSLEDDVWKMRWRIMTTVTRLGLGALVIDTDMVVLADPFKALSYDSDMEVMTDHFFPEKHLFLDWVRVEDHINTGFLWGRGQKTAMFVRAFLEENQYEWIRGIPRHKIDQNVFNRFVLRALREGRLRAAYQDLRFGAAGPDFSLRVLDPAVVCHGMNFFWRKAHRLHRPALQPVVAHANGVDAKEYFLRDRGVWYLDDWDARWAREGGGRFLTYDHPSGLSLGEDFALLAAGLLVAYHAKRRLVLPRTMNCANCPAYYAYGLNSTLQGLGCTYDYFAWSQPLFGFFDGLFVEAGIVDHPRFQGLGRTTMRVNADLADSIEARTSILHIDDVQLVAETLQHDGHIQPSDLFQCSYMQFGWAWQACRDDAYVKAHRKLACAPSLDQQGCGYRALNCCENYWGWGEKLEYYTGVAWDLPCNCGLLGCEKAAEGDQKLTSGEGVPRLSGSERHCCQHKVGPPKPTCSQAPRVSDLPSTNVGKDTHDYPGGLLQPFANGEISVQEAWRTCSLHRQLSFGDRFEPRQAAHCTLLVGTWLVHAQAWDRLNEWLDFTIQLRRGMPKSKELTGIVSPYALRDLENRQVDWNSVAHDIAQLEFLAEHVPSARELLLSYKIGMESNDPSPFQWSYHRLAFADTCDSRAPLALMSALDDVFSRVNDIGYAVEDHIVDDAMLDDICSCLAQSTVWFGVHEGVGVTARLLDGLHKVRPLLDMAQMLSSQVARAPLLDVAATRHHLSSRSTALRGSAEDASLVAVFMAGRRAESAGLRILGSVVTPSTAWADATRSRVLDGNEGNGISYVPGRLVVWRGERIVAVEPSQSAASESFPDRRVDVKFLFGPRQPWPRTDEEREVNY